MHKIIKNIIYTIIILIFILINNKVLSYSNEKDIILNKISSVEYVLNESLNGDKYINLLNKIILDLKKSNDLDKIKKIKFKIDEYLNSLSNKHDKKSEKILIILLYLDSKTDLLIYDLELLSKYKLKSGGNIYYVDATNGNDNNDGLDSERAWKSLFKVNNFQYKPNDQILFKSGEKWIGKLNIYKYSGAKNNPIIYGSYGGDILPVITSYYPIDLSWNEYDTNFWQADILLPATHRLSINGKEILSTPLLSELGTEIPDLVQWHEDSNGRIYLYSDLNPNNNIINYNQEQNTLFIMAENIIVRDIDFQGGTQGSIKIYNSSDIIIDNVNSGKNSKNAIQVMGTKYLTIQNSLFDAYFTFDYSDADEYKLSSARGTTDAIIFSRSNSYSVIKNNYIKNRGHGSILLSSIDNYETKNIKIYNNYMTSPDITYGGRTAIYGNVHNIELFNNSMINISTQNQLGGYNNHIHHNIMNGFKSSPIKSYADIGVGIMLNGYGNIIENNIFANTDSECFKIAGSETYDNIFKNNILYNCGITMNGISIGLRPNDGGWMKPDALTFQNNIFSNNIIYSNGTVNIIKHYTDGEISLGEFEKKYSSMPSKNNYNMDPLFIGEDNFNLQVKSPAINSGIKSNSYFNYSGNILTYPYNIGIY